MCPIGALWTGGSDMILCMHMSEHKHKRHSKSLLLYHLVCPVKYRKKVITEKVGDTIKLVCIEISERYEITFVEIGVDSDHVHFLLQSVPVLSPSQIVNTIKSILAKKIFQLHPEIKQELWGASFWTSGYYINTVGQYANEETIQRYVKKQGNNYKSLYKGQLSLFN